ncbi:MAG: NADH-quinone oxidoreductase subunit NuoH [Deltaproteobacteria bacterium]|nr:NADH-quinone oxidoreductase subunit NuoH [Deltaproteobacteria bacterium]MBI3295460.1 NADH-quinone oxidoreductase subunit NuoH [Deltaproteobacteria bacterium]
MQPSAAFAHALNDSIGVLPLWSWAAVTAALVLFLLALPFAGFATFIERRVAAFFQDRLGPNRVGPEGILQFPADAVKMLAKEDFIPAGADRFLFNLAPLLVVVGALSAFAVLPLGRALIGADLNIGVVYVLAVTTLIPPGILLGSWASQNKWSLLGGLRAAAQIVSYEIAVALALVPPILVSGSLQVSTIVDAQGWAWGAENAANYHFWNLFYNPFTFVSAFVFFIAGLAETNRIPFDLPEAESELVSGFNTEFSGMRFGLYALGEFGDVFVMCAMFTALYLGGWQVPFVNLETFWIALPALVIALIHLTMFMAKTLSLVFIVMWLRWTLPRLRVDQLMGLCWKGLVPIALFNVVGTAIWMWVFHGQSLPQLLAKAFSG